MSTITNHEIQQRHEAIDALANEIKARHESCNDIQQHATEAITATIGARVEVARLVEAAHSQIRSSVAFAKWWRDQGMPDGWAAKYLRLAKTAGRNTIGDKGQLRLCGILPEAESGNDGQRRDPNPFEWTKWAGKIRARLTVDSVQSMGEVDRAVAMKQLKPLVDIYEALNKVS